MKEADIIKKIQRVKARLNEEADSFDQLALDHQPPARQYFHGQAISNRVASMRIGRLVGEILAANGPRNAADLTSG
jgi:phage terminase large subunit-like protein